MTINKDSHNLILSNLIDGIVITDNNKRIISCNNSYLKLIGYNLEEIKGTSYVDLVDIPFKNSEDLSLEAPVIKSYESKHIKKNGEKIHFHVRCMAINEVAEGQNGYVYNLQDITAYKDREKEAQEYAEKIKQFTKHLTQAHDQLLEAKIAAEVANKAKSMFLASMSHEIRSPLSSIIGFSEIMYEDDTLPKEEIKDMSHVILKSGRNLLELLNEILDLSKIEAGKIVIIDRYIMSSIAYGSHRINDLDWLENINSQFIIPDITFYIDSNPKICALRIKKSYFGLEMYKEEKELISIAKTYKKMVKTYDRVFEINGDREEMEITREIIKIVKKSLEKNS